MTHKLLRVAQSQFILGAATFTVLGRWLAAGHWTATAAAALIVRPGRQWNRPNAIFLAVLSAQAWATVVLPGLARSNAWWDVAHLTVSAAAAPVLYRAVMLEAVLRQTTDSRRAIVLTAAALTVTAGVVWELFEWRIDAAFNLHLAKGYADTMHDLLADTTGALTGSIYLAWTQRRLLHFTAR